MIDLLLLVVVGGSTALGLLRGFVGTLVSTAAWLLAGWAAFHFGEQAAFWLSDDGIPSPSELLGGYASIFVAVVVAISLAGMLVKSLVKSVGLSGLDRLLGMALGLLRGAFLGCLLVLLMGFTPITKEPSWKQSQLLPLLLPGAEWMHGQLPDWSVPQNDSRSDTPTGDNDGVERLPVPLLESAVLQAVDAARERIDQERAADAAPEPAGAGTSGEGPVNIEATGPDPAATEPPVSRPRGQARPKSQ